MIGLPQALAEEHGLDLVKELENVFVSIGEKVMPAVVHINTGHAAKGPEGNLLEEWEELFPFLPGRPKGYVQGSGSGLIIESSGLILTNNHVVSGASEDLIVVLQDGKEVKAKIRGQDPATDVALIEIKSDEELPCAVLGDSDMVKVGQFAIAIGNPFGFDRTMSVGHITGVGRILLPLEDLPYQDFIQTDAAINLGNSGGPLVNLKGEVIGLSTAIISGGAQNMGFAVPINKARQGLEQLKTQGHVVYGYLGLRIIPVEPDTYKELGLPDKKGALVQAVEKGYAGDKAGVQIQDVIRKINDKEIEDYKDLTQTVSKLAPGTEVKLEVLRDGKKVVLETKLSELPAAEKEDTSASQETALGLSVDNVTDALKEELDLDSKEGVVVKRVAPGSPSHRAGIRPGDVIVQVNTQKIKNKRDFSQATKQITVGSATFFHVKRGEQVQLVIVRTEEKESD